MMIAIYGNRLQLKRLHFTSVFKCPFTCCQTTIIATWHHLVLTSKYGVYNVFMIKSAMSCINMCANNTLPINANRSYYPSIQSFIERCSLRQAQAKEKLLPWEHFRKARLKKLTKNTSRFVTQPQFTTRKKKYSNNNIIIIVLIILFKSQFINIFPCANIRLPSFVHTY